MVNIGFVELIVVSGISERLISGIIVGIFVGTVVGIIVEIIVGIVVAIVSSVVGSVSDIIDVLVGSTKLPFTILIDIDK